MTNYEKIKNMSIEEMVVMFDEIRHFGCYYCYFHYERERKGLDRQCPYTTDCVEGYRKWLEQEVDND